MEPVQKVEVPASVVPELLTQTCRVLSVFALGGLLYLFIDSEVIIGAVLMTTGVTAVVGTAAAVWAYGIWQKIATHRALVDLANQLPNDRAEVVSK